ncbi:hypothetical protein DL766_008180 [Monosporascus sp. MC13-8B]|uniref:CREG-like beta-barrel domain-containing protein n=1 Tax=Monosporascus cannonballus TaxID=155416 RepID=A0ABY0GR60_9PEZI|nr:hypothetical protein DL762_010238 [Monosporascus cannonballus]RYO82866.1 hypothetical protein DL763_008098 [Monosporascus cannonballus]RYP20547.1 hypothetical protein DL766_008180 [Monosporascus sp. MC13-8B]
MRLSRHFPLISLAAGLGLAEQAVEPQHIFSNPPVSAESSSRIPTAYESAVLGRRILALTPLGTLSTVFPSSADGRLSGEEHRPAGLGGVPIGLVDYVADCEDDGNPTILAINIATSFQNVKQGSNISLAQRWTPRYPPDKRIKSSFLNRLLGREEEPEDPVPYSAANLPRFSLLGYLEKIDSTPSEALAACFVDKHPDAKYWLPGNKIHESEFVRLVVTQVYWIGGFGDRAYIGWIDPADWKNVTREEWEAVRLPGEKKGWKEWSSSRLSDL